MQTQVLLCLSLCLLLVSWSMAALCWSSSCYRWKKKPRTWEEARLHCSQTGDKLAEVESIQENAFIKRLLKDTDIGSTWLGASDELEENRWVWVSTGADATLVFNDWGPKQPNNYHGNQNCLQMYKPFDYRWDDDVCSEKHATLCEMDRF